MSFLDWFTGKTTTPTVTPTAPTAPPTPPAPAPASSTAIKIEHYNKTLRRWNEQPMPFFSSSQMDISQAKSSTLFKVRVTVLQGLLTITSATAKGPHNPTITKFTRNQTFPVGASFIVECKLGVQTVNRPGHWDDVLFSVYSREQGQIIGLTARVAYP